MQDVMKMPDSLNADSAYSLIGLREKHKLDTKHKIQEAASELFGKYGFQATTMEMIAASVEISPRTIFRYFDSKEDLLLSHVGDLLGSITEYLSERPKEEDCLTALKIATLLAVSGKNKMLTNVISNAIKEIGTERVASRLMTNMYHWEKQTAAIFYGRLQTGVIYRLSGVENPTQCESDNDRTALLKSTIAHLLAAIGSSIMKNILTDLSGEELKDAFLTEQIITTAFSFFERGCRL